MFIGRMNMHTVTCTSVTMHAKKLFSSKLQYNNGLNFQKIQGPIHSQRLDRLPSQALWLGKCKLVSPLYNILVPDVKGG